jgi:hypothetical protein
MLYHAPGFPKVGHYNKETMQHDSPLAFSRNINRVGFTLPIERTEQPRDERAVKQCKHIVLDFGANIGDTAGKVIDAGLYVNETI